MLKIFHKIGKIQTDISFEEQVFVSYYNALTLDSKNSYTLNFTVRRITYLTVKFLRMNTNVIDLMTI